MRNAYTRYSSDWNYQQCGSRWMNVIIWNIGLDRNEWKTKLWGIERKNLVSPSKLRFECQLNCYWCIKKFTNIFNFFFFFSISDQSDVVSTFFLFFFVIFDKIHNWRTIYLFLVSLIFFFQHCFDLISHLNKNNY